MRAAVSWSGGKDSCLALMRAQATLAPSLLLTMFDETAERSRSHGLRREVVAAQADRLQLPLFTGAAAWPDYEARFVSLLQQAAAAGCTHVVFGDIFEDAHRRWTERVATLAGLEAVQPIWGEPTLALATEFLERGGRARLTTVRQAALEERWLGAELTIAGLAEFEALGIDPAGERGEYHTVVTDCPLFHSPLELQAGARVERGGCWALDFQLAGSDTDGGLQS